MNRKTLMDSASGQDKVAVFRKMLLDVLTGQRGSPVVEKAYLASYRSRLEQLVDQQPSQSLAAGRRSAHPASMKPMKHAAPAWRSQFGAARDAFGWSRRNLVEAPVQLPPVPAVERTDSRASWSSGLIR